MFDEMEFILDGNSNGIRCYLTEERKYLTLRRGKNTLFKNYDVLKSRIKEMALDPFDYRLELSLTVNDQIRSFSFNDVYPIKEKHMYLCHVDSNQGTVHEVYLPTVVCIGYIRNKYSDVECKSSVALFKKQKKIMDKVHNCILELQKYQQYGLLVERTNKEMVISMRQSSGKIHVSVNSNIMDMNNARKAEDKRCMPYTKGMNKFGTLYVYTTREFDDTDVDDEITSILNVIITYLSDLYQHDEFEYIPVQYSGYINL